VKIADNTWST